jgi:hypothetical protein
MSLAAMSTQPDWIIWLGIRFVLLPIQSLEGSSIGYRLIALETRSPKTEGAEEMSGRGLPAAGAVSGGTSSG